MLMNIAICLRRRREYVKGERIALLDRLARREHVPEGALYSQLDAIADAEQQLDMQQARLQQLQQRLTDLRQMIPSSAKHPTLVRPEMTMTAESDSSSSFSSRSKSKSSSIAHRLTTTSTIVQRHPCLDLRVWRLAQLLLLRRWLPASAVLASVGMAPLALKAQGCLNQN